MKGDCGAEQKQAKKARIAEKKAVTAVKQAIARATAALRQLARAAMGEDVNRGVKTRLPARLRAKGNYLLLIEEGVF